MSRIDNDYDNDDRRTKQYHYDNDDDNRRTDNDYYDNDDRRTDNDYHDNDDRRTDNDYHDNDSGLRVRLEMERDQRDLARDQPRMQSRERDL
jgi:hypothetical protein